jgi:hypothetical protein
MQRSGPIINGRRWRVRLSTRMRKLVYELYGLTEEEMRSLIVPLHE